MSQRDCTPSTTPRKRSSTLCVYAVHRNIVTPLRYAAIEVQTGSGTRGSDRERASELQCCTSPDVERVPVHNGGVQGAHCVDIVDIRIINIISRIKMRTREHT